MAIITGPDGTPLTVDSTALAIRGTPYSSDAIPMTTRYTYASCTTRKQTLNGSATTPLATLYGAAGRVIRLVRFRGFFTVATTAAYNDLYLRKVTGSLHPTSGSTATTLFGRTPYDSAAPLPLAVFTVWSTGPTAAPMTSNPPTISYCGNIQAYVPITGTPARQPGAFIFEWDANRNPVLNGASEGFELFWGSSFATTLTGTVEITWTEEPTDG